MKRFFIVLVVLACVLWLTYGNVPSIVCVYGAEVGMSNVIEKGFDTIPVDRAQAFVDDVERTTYQRDNYEIEIVDVNKIPNGIEVFVRAYELGRQIGFGYDGSVDVERFKIYGLGTLIEDRSGSISREWVNDEGVRTFESYTHDPQTALVSALEGYIDTHTKFDEVKIERGKIGNTTYVFYPDADPETSSVDGYFMTTTGAWSVVHEASSASSYDNSSIGWGAEITFDPFEEGYVINRYGVVFDVSALPATSTIGTSTIHIYSTQKYDDWNAEYSYVAVTPFVATSSNDLVNDDYDGFSDSVVSDTFDLTSLSLGWNTFTLTSEGRALVSTTTQTAFGIRVGHDIEDLEPLTSEYWREGLYFYMSEDATYRPYLMIEEGSSPEVPSEEPETELGTTTIALLTTIASSTVEGLEVAYTLGGLLCVLISFMSFAWVAFYYRVN